MELTSSAGRRERVTAAVLTVADEQGLDRATVREVASRAEVSIGTVQHYFPTKDAMLIAAFEEVVRRIRRRIDALRLTDDTQDNLVAVLRELLPLDQKRTTEVRVQLAFNARAMTDPELARIQRVTLTELHDGLRAVIRTLPGFSDARARTAGHALVATADGLALHAVTSGGWLSGAEQKRALAQVVASVLGDRKVDPRP